MDKLFDLGFPERFAVQSQEFDKLSQSLNTCCGELVEDDGHMICKNCFKMYPFLIDSKYEYNERQQPNIYIPSTYMKVRLNEFIGLIDKDITHILPLFFDGVSNERNVAQPLINGIERRNVQTTHDIYNVLKKNKLNTYYDTVYLIAKKVGVPYPRLSNEEIDKLIFLFNQIKIKLPYHFVLEKLFIKINRQDLIQFLHKTKNKVKYSQYQSRFSENDVFRTFP
jgi:hypothetical protein